jgi:transketolase
MDKQALEKIALSVRTLSIDAIQKAKSGHPGLPMGCAEIGSLIYGDILKYYPEDPDWIDRDRFILSAGHGVMLLYSLLHLAGYDLSLDEVKNFRQFGSITPGHPEYGTTPGVETTAGPLGQGISNAVGMVMAERILAEKFNTDKHKIIDHYTYVLASDGDLMEGVSSEAASLAGHHKLDKLIVMYDYNNITIEGNTDIAFTEDVLKRFEAYGWQTLTGDPYDYDNLFQTINKARENKSKPSIILLKTTIAKGSPNMAGSHKAHGAPLGDNEVRATKRNLGVPEDAMFYIAPEAINYFREKRNDLANRYNSWKNKFENWKNDNPELYREWQIYMGESSIDPNEINFSEYNVGDKMATRKASGKALNAIAEKIPNLIGGSADLAPSNATNLSDMGDFQPVTPLGRNFHFGVREHGMGSIVNGMALHGGLIPYCATFLVFSDYMRPPIRLASLMKLRVIYVFTHDSIYVGEDGPTHQPVEQIAALRSIPGLTVLRPADAEETQAAWVIAISNKNSPTALALTRQNCEVFKKQDSNWKKNIQKGAYIADDCNEEPDLIIVATGSEVNLALQVKEKLNKKVRVVSMLSKELFEAQDNDYKNTIIPKNKKRVVIEAGIKQGWEGIAGDDGLIISIEKYGESGPYAKVGDAFGFTAEKVIEKIS